MMIKGEVLIPTLFVRIRLLTYKGINTSCMYITKNVELEGNTFVGSFCFPFFLCKLYLHIKQKFL